MSAMSSFLALFRRKKVRSSPSALQKRYDPHDPKMTFVDRVDDLERFGNPSLRAQMSCGHAVTPISLTNWCLHQLDKGKIRFMCAKDSCGAEWSYEEVCKMALLTSKEKSYFQKTLALNAAAAGCRTCPYCKTPVVRQKLSDLCVSCQVCQVNKGRVYEFCWQCLRKWRGPKPRLDHCQNKDCCNSALKTLKTCPDVVIESVPGCPSIRACPTCGSLQEHNGTGCKTTFCPQCGLMFCFVCLKTSVECSQTTRLHNLCFSGVAVRQTSIPVWNRK